MEYQEFFHRFIGACRSKHQLAEPTLIELVKQALRPSRRPSIHPLKGARYRIPGGSELDKGFIRMEPWEVEYLFALAAYARLGIVETGRAHGGSTLVLACANGHVPIHSIDIAPIDDERLRGVFAAVGVGGNVEAIVGDSQRGAYPDVRAIDLLFIDGDHSVAGCTADLEQWYPRVAPGGHVLLHDCYAGSGVQRAVIDFIDRQEVEVIQSPYIGSSHWRHPAGSLAHFRKPRAAPTGSPA